MIQKASVGLGSEVEHVSATALQVARMVQHLLRGVYKPHLDRELCLSGVTWSSTPSGRSWVKGGLGVRKMVEGWQCEGHDGDIVRKNVMKEK